LEDLSLHILDVAENGLKAGAKQIRIRILEDLEADRLELEVEDDGSGMDPEMTTKALDPFVTTRTTRRVGLGLPFLREAARMTGGEVELDSFPGRGTRVRATFQHSHIDRKPLGDMGATLVGILLGGPHVDISYEHIRAGRTFCLDTRELRRELDPVPITQPEVLEWIRQRVREGLREIGALES
jgi:hypothetical protein